MYRLLSTIIVVTSLACTGEIGDVNDPGVDEDEETPTPRDALGAGALRRLDRATYSNIIADVLGDTTNPGRSLPEDDDVGGYVAATSIPATGHIRSYASRASEVSSRFFATHPERAACSTTGTVCASSFFDDVVPALIRRPPDDVYRALVLGLYASGTNGDGHAAGMTTLLEGVLQSPEFLYVSEPSQVDATRPRLARIDDYAIAARMAAVFWRSAPDTELLDAARRGELADPATRAAQARRLFAHPRSNRLLRSFFRQWLEVGGPETLSKDRDMFPDFDAAAARGLYDAFDAFVREKVRAPEGTLASLLESGILMQPAVQAAHAGATDSKIPQRGKLIRDRVICAPVPPPPAVFEDPALSMPDATKREIFATHQSDPGCASCHRSMDPLGFAFEHYDAIGAYRETWRDKPIDASGTLYDIDVEGDFADAQELSAKLAVSEDVAACFVSNVFTYAMARAPTRQDRWVIEDLATAFASSGGNIAELFVALVAHESFILRSTDSEACE